MKKVFSLLFLVCVLSCKNEYKNCLCTTGNETLKAYSEVLNELVEHHFYNLYLGNDGEKVSNNWTNDTNIVRQNIIKLQNKLYEDSTKLCTLYLDTFFIPSTNPWAILQNDTNALSLEIKQLVLSFNNKNPQLVIDSLNTLQTRFSANDFTLCSSVLKPISRALSDHPRCVIGRVAFSKIYFNNEETKGLLYYQFICGGMCGKTEILVIRKDNKVWHIIEQHLLTIS